MTEKTATAVSDCFTYYFPSQYTADLSRLCQRAAEKLPPGGMISIRDWLVPGNRLRGKKARLQREAGLFVNLFLALAGEGYGRGLSLPQYEDLLWQGGFQRQQCLVQARKINFHDWIVPARLSARDTLRLKALLIQAPPAALEYLTPQFAGDRISFRLQEILITGRLGSKL